MKDQLSVLSRLRMDMERQLQALPETSSDGEVNYRRGQLEQSLSQLDEQIRQLQEQVNECLRAVRMLESSPHAKGRVHGGTAEVA